MISLKGLCGLAPGVISQAPRFSGTGMVAKPLPVYDLETNDICEYVSEFGVPWVKPFTSVKLSIGPSSIRFVIDASDLMSFLRRPVILLRNAVLSAQKVGIAPPSWKVLFDRSGNSPITIDLYRYYFLAAVIDDNGQIYNPPLGSSQPFVLLNVSKTAGEGIVSLAVNKQVNLFEQPIAISIVPQPAKSTGGMITPSSYVIKTISMPYNYDFTSTINSIKNTKLGWHNILKPLDPKDEVVLLTQSQVPVSAIVYALAGSEWQEMLPPQYLSLGLAKLDQEVKGGASTQSSGMPSSPVTISSIPTSMPTIPPVSPSVPDQKLQFSPTPLVSRVSEDVSPFPEQNKLSPALSLEELRKILKQVQSEGEH